MNTPNEVIDPMHGAVGDGGMFMSQAKTLAYQLYDPARTFANYAGHDADIKVLDGEQAQVANLFHKNFSQTESKALVNQLGRHAKPLAEGRDEASLEASEKAAHDVLARRHGAAGSTQLYGDANIAITKLTKAAPALKRLLIENGGQHDPDLIEHLAAMARAKGWK